MPDKILNMVGFSGFPPVGQLLEPRFPLKVTFLIAAFTFLSGVWPRLVWATPQVIRVDGSVFDANGAPITASKDIQIKAYDASTSGTLLWTSSIYNTSVTSGRFTINLDASSGSPSLVDRLGASTTAEAIYFQIEVDSGAANGSMDSAIIVLPRVRAKGAMFALASATTSGLRTIPISTAVPNSGEYLKYDGSSWIPSSFSGSGGAAYQTTAGSCATGFTSVDTRTLYMCMQGSSYSSGQIFAAQIACPTAAPTSTSGTAMTSNYWAAQLASGTLRTCFKSSGSGCYQTTSGSCEGTFTQVDTYSIYQCSVGSAFFDETRPVESPLACPTATPTTTTGSPPMSGFWAAQVGSSTLRTCCK